MRWPAYLRGILAFSIVGVLFLYLLYLLQRLQGVLPGSLGFASIDPDQAFNTAASFVTNTNWQSYYGEQAMGHVVRVAGLAVQNFVPAAAAGMAPAVALVQVRELVDEHTDGRTLGFIGEPRVNVLGLNIALKALVAKS